MPLVSNPLTPTYRWNPLAARYVSASTGRFVPRQAVVDELERLITLEQEKVAALAGQLQAGSISIADWQLAMAQEIKIGFTAAAAAARGGWAQMSQSDWGLVGQQIREQYQYLRRFALQIESGEQPLNGVFVYRCKMYANASYAMFERMMKRVMRLAGKTEERRFLDPSAEHCPGCVENAAAGWVEIGQLPPIGDSQCLTSCRCHDEYR